MILTSQHSGLRTHLDADIELGGPDGAGRGAGQRVDLGPGVGSLHVQAQVLEAVEAVAVVAADTRRARTGQQLAEGSLQVEGGDGGHGDQVSGYLDMVDSVVWMLAKLLRAATGCCDLTGVAGAAGLTHWRLETEAGLGWAGLGWWPNMLTTTTSTIHQNVNMGTWNYSHINDVLSKCYFILCHIFSLTHLLV